MRFLVLSMVVCINMSFALAQNDPAPKYLVNKSFPDSVKNLSLIDVQGGEVLFGDILKANQGKKMVIDIWASWCGDCKVGMSSLKKLQDKSDEQDVVYVLLSLDKDTAKWKAAIDTYALGGQHYLVPQGWKNPLSNYINLDWIPRYLVVNEQSKIILPKAITAKDEKMSQLLF